MILNCMSNLQLPTSNNILFEGDLAIISNLSYLHDYNILKRFFKNMEYFKEIVIVPGSYDYIFNDSQNHNNFIENNHNHYIRKLLRNNIKDYKTINEFDNIIILYDESIELDINGDSLKVYGQCFINENKFKYSSIKYVNKHILGISNVLPIEEIKIKRDKIEKCDILVTSYPPYGHFDKGLGCKFLEQRISEIKPTYTIFSGFEKLNNSYQYSINTVYVNSNIYHNDKKSIILNY